MRTFSITRTVFEKRREDDKLQPGCYRISDWPRNGPVTYSYGYSPDGIGVIWYETAEQMIADVG